jgi:hypothetical protein
MVETGRLALAGSWSPPLGRHLACPSPWFTRPLATPRWLLLSQAAPCLTSGGSDPSWLVDGERLLVPGMPSSAWRFSSTTGSVPTSHFSSPGSSLIKDAASTVVRPRRRAPSSITSGLGEGPPVPGPTRREPRRDVAPGCWVGIVVLIGTSKAGGEGEQGGHLVGDQLQRHPPRERPA